MDLTIPAPPPPGSTIAVVSPSAPGIALWPHRVEAGLTCLANLGFETRLMPNCRKHTGWTAGSPQERAEDLIAAFADPEISVVIASVGGNHSAQVLDYLDYEVIANNPKIFQGYSDITTLHWALMRHAGLRTFYGPALISQLGEHPKPFEYTIDWMLKAWSGESLDFSPAERWTEEFLDWNKKLDLERPRQLKSSTGWVCVREGRAEGFLLGGCLETISWHLVGTDEWIDPQGALFFLETSEEAPSPAQVDAYLTTLERIGVFDAASGLVVGRAYGYDESMNEALFEVLEARTARSQIPVLANFDIGHTDPMVTLPMGRRARLDASDRLLETTD